ncbi:hypothetical protein M0R45_009091 [Rubus argutus]|uniref:Protein FAR1-RELATED SEQUENCE n=1 Tax=Rubus argutus TaxID=59490 RepID=A0AAW1Y5J3_RUBAR
MSSSQRVESAHAFFKRYCDKENSLMDFVTRFNRALAHQRHEELIEDHRDLNETPNLRHILAFFRVKQIMQLPKEYILRRWTRFSRVRKERYKVQDGADNSLIMRHTGMFKLASALIDEAAISLDGTTIVQKAFEGLIEQIKKLNLSSGETASVNYSTVEISEENRFLDPSQVRAKGCGKRIPSWRDRKGKKDRHCSVCRSTEHTKKKCPQLVSLGVVENKVDEALGEQETTNDEL